MVQRGGQAVTGASRGWGGRAPRPSQDAFGGRGTIPHGRGAFFGSGQGFRSGGRGVFGGGGRGRGGLHQRFGGRGGRSFGGSVGGLGTDKQGWQEVAKGPRDSSHEVKAFEQMTKKSGEELVLDGSADVQMEDIQEQADGDGKVVRTGARCSRCTKKGHVAANCSAEIYCVICDSHEHVNHRCPILKMPRPVAHAVGYAVHGLGFYHIPHSPLLRARKDSKMALISVIGGSLSKVQVISQLQRVVPVKWTWVLKDHGDGEFIAQFPSKSKLQRSIAFGGADVKEVGVPQGVRLKFEEWHEKEEGFLLPKVWIRVVGLRKNLKEFLNLWAVGSMLGSTQAVDMETTRKEDFGRIFVAVLNPKLIPAHLDVVIGDHYFELDFEVEKRGFDENGDEGDIEWNGGDNGDNDSNKDGGYDGNENGTGDNFENDDLLDDLEENRDNKRQISEGGKKVGEHPPNDSVAGIHSMKEKIQNMSEAEFTEFLKLKAAEILDTSANKVLEEAVNVVVPRIEVWGVVERSVEAGIDSTTLSDGGALVVDVLRENVVPDGLNVVKKCFNSGQQIGTVSKDAEYLEVELVGSDVSALEVGSAVTDGSQMVVAGELSEDKIRASATISEVLLSPSRSSPRLARVVDEHTMKRAERRAVARNLEQAEGYFQGEVLDQALVPAI